MRYAIHIGEHGLLGVSVDGTVASGVAVVGVQSGSAAAQAGITTGDLVTAISGPRVDSAAALSAALATTHVGDEVSVTWQETSGADFCAVEPTSTDLFSHIERARKEHRSPTSSSPPGARRPLARS